MNSVYQNPSVYKCGISLQDVTNNITWSPYLYAQIAAGAAAYDSNRKPSIRICKSLKLAYISGSIPLKGPIPSNYTSTYNLCTFSFTEFTMPALEFCGVNMTSGKDTLFMYMDNQGIKIKIINGDNYNTGDNVVFNPFIMPITLL